MCGKAKVVIAYVLGGLIFLSVGCDSVNNLDKEDDSAFFADTTFWIEQNLEFEIDDYYEPPKDIYTKYEVSHDGEAVDVIFYYDEHRQPRFKVFSVQPGRAEIQVTVLNSVSDEQLYQDVFQAQVISPCDQPVPEGGSLYYPVVEGHIWNYNFYGEGCSIRANGTCLANSVYDGMISWEVAAVQCLADTLKYDILRTKDFRIFRTSEIFGNDTIAIHSVDTLSSYLYQDSLFQEPLGPIKWRYPDQS